MSQLISLVLFGGIITFTIYAVIRTIREELPHVLKALGVDPPAPPALQNERRKIIKAIKHKV